MKMTRCNEERDPPSKMKLVRLQNTGLWPLECGEASRHLRGWEGSPGTGIRDMEMEMLNVSRTRLVISVLHRLSMTPSKFALKSGTND